jgi:hypothetical protein
MTTISVSLNGPLKGDSADAISLPGMALPNKKTQGALGDSYSRASESSNPAH